MNLKKYSYSNKKMYMLTIHDYFIKNKIVYYNCTCDCGKKSIVRWDCFERKNPTKSCGCARKIQCKLAQIMSANSKRLPLDEKAKRIVIGYYKVGAKRRGYEFNLTDEQFFTLTQGNCYYCNEPPSNSQKTYRSKVDKIYEEFIYNGIDRINNNEGYVLTNCVSCCIICNRMKTNMSENDFIAHLNKIKNFYENK